MVTKALVAIVDRASQLVRERPTDYRRVFVDHADPIYMDMIEVHLDYVSALSALVAAAMEPTVSETELLEIAVEWQDVRHALERFAQEDTRISLALPQKLSPERMQTWRAEAFGERFAQNVAL